MSRTTLTLDDDIAGRLKEEMQRSGASFKETVNHLLRLGLDASRQPRMPRRFEVRPRDLKPLPGVSYDNIEELLEQIEDTRYR